MASRLAWEWTSFIFILFLTKCPYFVESRQLYLILKTDIWSIDNVALAADEKNARVQTLDAMLMFETDKLDPQLSTSSFSHKVGYGGLVISAADKDIALVFGVPLPPRLSVTNTELVIDLGIVDLTNRALFDPQSYDGLIPRTWSHMGEVRDLDNSVVDWTYRFLKGLCVPRQVDIPAEAETFFKAYARYRMEHPENFPNVFETPTINAYDHGLGHVQRFAKPSLMKEPLATQFDFTPKSLAALYNIENLPPIVPAHVSSGEDPAAQYELAELGPDALAETEKQAGPSEPVAGEANESDEDMAQELQREADDLAETLGFGICDRRRWLEEGKNNFGRRAATCGSSPQTVDKGQTGLITTRVGGRLSTFATTSLRVVGNAALLILPAFIILDIIEGQWTAAVWAAGSGIVGVGADLAATAAIAATGATIGGLAVAGPVGLVVGALAALLFSFLPGLFKSHDYPPTNNITEIIQYAFFGSPQHTGNEKCNQQLAANNQTQNCTVLYGMNTLASIFNWDGFTAASFVIVMNNGYAMNIPDMALNFTVRDYTNPGATANSMAIIDCGKGSCRKKGFPQAGPGAVQGEIPCSPSTGYDCQHPKFTFNLTLASLPMLNQRAEQVSHLVNTGECKIVSNPVEGQSYSIPASDGSYPVVNQTFDAFAEAGVSNGKNETSSNATSLSDPGFQEMDFKILPNGTVVPVPVTSNSSNSSASNETSLFIRPLQGTWNSSGLSLVNMTGMPVYIGCNLTQDIPNVLASNYSIVRQAILNDSYTTTDANQSVPYIPPPPPQPFTILSPSNSICLSNSRVPQNLLCMRPGTFSTSTGAFGYSTSDLDTLSSFDISSNITGSLSDPSRPNEYRRTSHSFVFENVKASSALQKAMRTATSQKRTFNISISSEAAPKVAPMMCVFSETNYSGDFWCLGVGGTNFTSKLGNKIASLTMSPGLAARLYPGWYGNPLDAVVSTDVADLSELPYLTGGKGQTFKDNVAAAWIYQNGKT